MSGLLERIARRRRAASKDRPAPRPPASSGPAAPTPPAPAREPPEPKPPAPASAPPEPEPLVPAPEPALEETPDFRERGALRRRARYLRRLREVQLRDLGGLVVELHRFGRERPDLVEAKVAIASNTASELRTLELALRDRRSVRELREPGIGGACSQCGALHGSSDRFCASCGLPIGPPPDPNGELDPAPSVERGKLSDPSTPHAGPAP